MWGPTVASVGPVNKLVACGMAAVANRFACVDGPSCVPPDQASKPPPGEAAPAGTATTCSGCSSEEGAMPSAEGLQQLQQQLEEQLQDQQRQVQQLQQQLEEQLQDQQRQVHAAQQAHDAAIQALQVGRRLARPGCLNLTASCLRGQALRALRTGRQAAAGAAPCACMPPHVTNEWWWGPSGLPSPAALPGVFASARFLGAWATAVWSQEPHAPGCHLERPQIVVFAVRPVRTGWNCFHAPARRAIALGIDAPICPPTNAQAELAAARVEAQRARSNMEAESGANADEREQVEVRGMGRAQARDNAGSVDSNGCNWARTRSSAACQSLQCGWAVRRVSVCCARTGLLAACAAFRSRPSHAPPPPHTHTLRWAL